MRHPDRLTWRPRASDHSAFPLNSPAGAGGTHTETAAVPDEMCFDWNGELIRFSDWDDDAYGTYTYTTRNRRHEFEFDLQPVGSEVRVNIISQPSYGSRPDDGHSTHRNGLLVGKPSVCIRTDLLPTTVGDALSWAIYWAENTADYIDIGKSFT